ncbi:lipoprotein [Sulfurimicrobium lacus]|uniref:Lipoprotein n=1 Tax=Sulfurimicrobium lacus TaxID=2715678 RepID=A0A6F8V828_9PROT|nr:sialidase family protein [Sulfurimicrobium lacus]BCB25166.1 lipoprotein [Sulfurimicrobium lacus]
MHKAALAWFVLATGLGLVSQATGQSAPMDHGAMSAAAERDAKWKAALAVPSFAGSTTFDENGRLWRTSALDGYLRADHSDDRGKTWSPPVKINLEPENILGGGENRPKILVRKGVVYVSYTQGLEKPMTGHIRFSRSVDGGKTFSPPLTVNDNPDIISHRFDAMGVNGQGQVYLAWLDKRDLSAAQKTGRPYNGAAVYYARSDDNGASFLPNVKLADHSCECCRVALAMDPEGKPVVFWRHIFGRNTRDFALARLDGPATVVRATHDDWEVSGCPHHGGALSIGADGIYHMVWFNNGPERHGLFYGSTKDAGRTFSAPIPFGNEDAQAAHPDVLSQGRRVFVVWKEFDGKESLVQEMHSVDGGATWSGARRLAASAGASDHPLLIGQQDKAFLSWQTEKDGLQLLEIRP